MKRGQKIGEIDVQVKGKNLTVTPRLRDLVVQKMRRLDRYHDRLQNIAVELCEENTRESSQHNRVEVTAHVLGRTIRVVAAGGEMYAAVDEAVDKLQRRLSREKERLKSHDGTKFAETIPDDLAVQPVDVEDIASGGIVRVKQIEMKPIFEDEALQEMEDLGHTFYVFLNARTEQVNVLYRRHDGDYGLIEATAR